MVRRLLKQWLGAISTTVRNSIPSNLLLEGDQIWNITTQTLQSWNGVAWVDVGGGGASTFIDPLPTTATVGGIPIGSTFPLPGKTMQQMWDLLLYPFISPTFTSFLMTGIAVLEVGDSIDGVNQVMTWTTTQPGNILANSISIDDVTGVVNLETGLPNTGTVTHDFSGAPITYNNQNSNLFRITGTDIDPAGPFNFTYDLTIYWWWMVYAGTDATTPLVEADIEALSDYAALSAGFARTYSFSAGDYKYICYPASMGTATVFKDTATNLDVPMEAPYNVNVTNSQGILTAYRVHRTTNILGAAMDIAVS